MTISSSSSSLIVSIIINSSILMIIIVWLLQPLLALLSHHVDSPWIVAMKFGRLLKVSALVDIVISISIY